MICARELWISRAVSNLISNAMKYGGNGTKFGSIGSGGDEFVTPKMQLIGDSWAEFDNGKRKIVDGRMVEKDNECVISQELAELNKISVGDTITLKS
ncbi:hypothetical protein B1222_02045 [Paenibacillus larvae subsp. pulvifaciens]|nr:hypothetical protein B1222_02045 [Paenibacillus larvae subsp. pulvifaciens]AQZ48593.1 hypothetical protein B5S25_20470 [Paenibacillus larvae subsp. pulvifaciens]ETK26825.1 hypothetical protein ERIC1_1c02580 [Paenibacillus larvae subsp. larvae DSM 25719]